VDRDELARRGYEAASHEIRTGQATLTIEVPPRMSPEASAVLNRAMELARERAAGELEPEDLRRALDESGENAP
jgi:hypothetical protein